MSMEFSMKRWRPKTKKKNHLKHTHTYTVDTGLDESSSVSVRLLRSMADAPEPSRDFAVGLAISSRSKHKNVRIMAERKKDDSRQTFTDS